MIAASLSDNQQSTSLSSVKYAMVTLLLDA